MVDYARHLMRRAAVVAVIVVVVHREAALLHIGELPHYRFAADVARGCVGHLELVVRGAAAAIGVGQAVQRVVAVLVREGPAEVVFAACRA